MNAVLAAVEKLTERIARLEQAVKAPPRTAWRPREVAEQTGIRYEEVLKLIHSGELGSVPAGRLHVVPDEELKRYLARGVKSEAAA
jgi:excisionase family DNA binding protein